MEDIFRAKRPLNEEILGEGKFINVSVNAEIMKVIEKDIEMKKKQIQFDIFNEYIRIAWVIIYYKKIINYH